MSASSTPKPIGRSRRARPLPKNPYKDKDRPRRVMIYLRVSSEEQAEGHSLDAQERECREYLANQKANWEIVGIYSDEHSGKTDNRPDFQKMMQQVFGGQADAIVAHRLDRFSRNLHQILSYFKELERIGVVMAFAKDQFDFSTEEGRLQFHILAVFADWYLRNPSRETRKGKYQRVLKGKHNNQPPIGYQVDEEGVATAVPEIAELIEASYELYASGGYTDRKIADFLNQRGLKTRRGRAWSKDSAREVMQNEFYLGWVKYKGDLYPGLHEAIISKDLFDRVQTMRKRNARRPRAMGVTNRIFLLSALGRCSKCGRTLRAQGKVGRRYAYYREVSRDRGFQDCPDSGTGIRQDLTEAQLGMIMMHFVLPVGWQQEIRQELGQHDLVAQILQERKRLEIRLRRVGELYADGVYDHMIYRNERDEVRNKLAQLVVPEPSNVLDAGKQLETLGEIWPDASEKQQQKLCRLILRAVYIDVAAKRIVRIVPNDDFNILFRYHPYLESQADGGYEVVIPGSLLDSISFCQVRQRSYTKTSTKKPTQ